MNRQAPTARTITTGCKINLYLKILDVLPNGYHRLETLLIPLDTPSDTLTITPLTDAPVPGVPAEALPNGPAQTGTAPAPLAEGIRVTCPQADIPLADNTLTRAYVAYAEATGFAPRLHVHLRKGVPHGAGLGGGSANAAGLLLYLQEKCAEAGGTPLAPKALNALAATVGADVPFFLGTTPARATGIGETLTPCGHPYAGWHLVLVCPDIRISTAWAFKALDEFRGEKSFSGKNCLTSSGHQATSSFAHGVHEGNDFESIVFPVYPEIFALRKKLKEEGARIARLTGTGASLFGLFSDRKKAEKAAGKLDSLRGKVYLTTV